jgi:DnaJ-class molecular chaperone
MTTQKKGLKPSATKSATPKQDTTTRHYGPCPACSGTGTLRNLIRMRSVGTTRGAAPPRERSRTCNICQGKGQVITRETIKSTPGKQ